MKTGLAEDKQDIRDQEMSPALGLRLCHGEGCPRRAWGLTLDPADRCWGVPLPAACHSPLLAAAFQSWSSFPSVSSR